MEHAKNRDLLAMKIVQSNDLCSDTALGIHRAAAGDGVVVRELLKLVGNEWWDLSRLY